jgi:hypothetical protein
MKVLQGLEKVLHIEVNLKEEIKKVSLVAHVLDEEERIERDRQLVKISGDINFDDLPVASKLRIWSLVTLRLAIKEIPTWLNDLIGKHDELLFSIYKEVDALEQDYFLGYLGKSEATKGATFFQITAKPISTTS